jgi:hypothetical protein
MNDYYTQITRDKRINFINYGQYKGYWDGDYIEPRVYKGVYNDFITDRKISAIYKWNNDYRNGEFIVDYPSHENDAYESQWTTNISYKNLMSFISLKANDNIINKVFNLNMQNIINNDTILIMKPGFFYKYNITNYVAIIKNSMPSETYILSEWKHIKVLAKHNVNSKIDYALHLDFELAYISDIYYMLIPITLKDSIEPYLTAEDSIFKILNIGYDYYE